MDRDASADPRDARRRRLLAAAAAALASGAAMSSRAAAGDASAPSPILQRPIPRTGEKLPAVGLGTWQSFDVASEPDEVARAMEALRALVDGGGSVVDSSPMYGTAESVVGRVASELGVHPRLFLATKVWTSGRDAGLRQMEQSMTRMQVARKGPLDLMQVHNLVDVETHLATLGEWKQAGRVRHVGITHYTASAHANLEKLVRRGGIDFLQINYSIAEPQAGARLLPAAAAAGVAVIVNRPFAEGALMQRVKGRPLPAFAAELGATSWAQLFLKWILADPAVTVAIPGTRNPRHVADNLAAAKGPLPDAALRARIAEAAG
jgi:diketogulonate reductase-like aldo/keto reductase